MYRKRLTMSQTPADQSWMASGWHSLPAEIRLMIYPLTWEPRVVQLDQKKPRKMKRYRRKENAKFKVRSLPPTTLHLNYEARQLTLRHYVQFFETNYCGSVSYFNPALDTLHLSFCPGYKTLMTYHPDIERLFDIMVVARHITIPSPAMARGPLMPLESAVLINLYTFDMAPGCWPNRLPAIRTIDYLSRRCWWDDPDSETLMWVRQCCEPACRALIDQDYSQDTHPDGASPWYGHVFEEWGPVEARGVMGTYRPCEEIMAESTFTPVPPRVPGPYSGRRPRPVPSLWRCSCHGLNRHS